MREVYLGLGGNEGIVLPRLQQALKLLSCQSGIANMKNSHFYRSAPLQVDSPQWFVNAVCSFQTFLAPNEIFKITQAIETKLGKVAKPKNASRPIDIDILFYGEQTFQEDDLEIPHPRWKERLFVLLPLADLTHQVILHGVKGTEEYFLQEMIHSHLKQSTQSIELLEKNLDFQ